MNIDGNKLKSLIFFFIFVFLFASFSLLFLLEKPQITNDEALYSDITANFVSGKGLRTSLFKDFIPGIEKNSYWYPPLYFLSLSFFYSLFGPGIIISRIFSLIAGILSLILVYLISEKFFKKKFLASLVVAILVSDKFFQEAAVISRMEILVLSFGLACLYLYQKYLDNKNLKFLIFSGIFAGLGLLTHPLGLIFILSIIFFHFICNREPFKKKLKKILIFLTPILVFSFFWIWSFIGNLSIFIRQYQAQLLRKRYITSFITLILKEKSYLGFIFLIFTFSNLFFLGRNLLKKEVNQKKQLLFPLVIFSFSLPVLGKEIWYMVFLSVFAIIALVSNLEYFLLKKRYFLFFIVGAVFLLNSKIFLDSLWVISNRNQRYWDFCTKLAKNIPKKTKVLISAIPDPYFCLKSQRPDLQLREVPNAPSGQPINKATYNKIFSQVDYVIISFYPNESVKAYLEKNYQLTVYKNTEPGSYFGLIIKLKDVNKREQF